MHTNDLLVIHGALFVLLERERRVEGGDGCLYFAFKLYPRLCIFMHAGEFVMQNNNVPPFHLIIFLVCESLPLLSFRVLFSSSLPTSNHTAMCTHTVSPRVHVMHIKTLGRRNAHQHNLTVSATVL